MAARMSGVLYVVPTPLGNLEDITLRALRVLREVGLIAAEDTRHSRKLLTHFDIHKPLVSYHQHNKLIGLNRILQALVDQDVALISDAGMPAIADPGFELIRAVLEAGFRMEVLPGPSAVTSAYVLAALPSPGFLFLGFLPRQSRARVQTLQRVAALPYALILFEAPHRLRETLAALIAVLGDRPAVAVRELSKIHEEVIRGSLRSLSEHFNVQEPRGEFTLVVGGAEERRVESSPDEVRTALARLRAEGVTGREAVRRVSEALSLPRSEVYQIWLTMRNKGWDENES
jgi:16S rRNA (cytidine1402-2'-O)-methyltransferase